MVKMKKNLFLIIVFACFVLVPSVAMAEETLQDNNFELKTDRLNKDQTEDGKTNSFTADDHLFEEETIQQLEKNKEEAKKQRAKEVDQLFLSDAKKVKELETTQLFTEKKSEKSVAASEETTTSVSSPIPLLPIAIIGLVITAITLIYYHSRNRGK